MTEIGQRVFRVYASGKKVGRWVGRLGTYTLAHLQALWLTNAAWICDQMVIHLAPDTLPPITFSLSPTVFEQNQNKAFVAPSEA